MSKFTKLNLCQNLGSTLMKEAQEYSLILLTSFLQVKMNTKDRLDMKDSK